MKPLQLFVFLLLVYEVKSQNPDTLISIYFKTDSYQVDLRDKNVLKSAIKTNTRVLSIKGFADSIGQRKNNFILVENRLKSTLDILRETSADLRGIQIINGGEEILSGAKLSSCRRVDILIGIEPATNGNAYNENNYRKELFENEIKKFNSLANFQFEPDKAILTFDSYQYVDQLYNLMEGNDVKIEIVGHVNYQSKRDQAHLKSLYELSTNRAKVIYELLLEKGIRAERMTFQGVGNSEPIFLEPKNEEQKRKNMRVEIKIR